MSQPDPGKGRTSIYRRDFIGKLEILGIRIRFKLDRLKQGDEVAETEEQLNWALQELDSIRARYTKKLPWPSGAFAWVLEDSWPAGSDLKTDLLKLEKEYYAQITKPPRE